MKVRSQMMWNRELGVGLVVVREDRTFTLHLRHNYEPASVRIVLPIKRAKHEVPVLLADISYHEEVYADLFARYCTINGVTARTSR